MRLFLFSVPVSPLGWRAGSLLDLVPLCPWNAGESAAQCQLQAEPGQRLYQLMSDSGGTGTDGRSAALATVAGGLRASKAMSVFSSPLCQFPEASTEWT